MVARRRRGGAVESRVSVVIGGVAGHNYSFGRWPNYCQERFWELCLRIKKLYRTVGTRARRVLRLEISAARHAITC